MEKFDFILFELNSNCIFVSDSTNYLFKSKTSFSLGVHYKLSFIVIKKKQKLLKNIAKNRIAHHSSIFFFKPLVNFFSRNYFFRLSFGLFCVTMFISMWISNTAATAMMIPIVETVLLELEAVSMKKNSQN